jgi:DNA repair exonuclease SbcCD ATPase subunit
MQKQLSKLMLRAFNGECEAAVARVTWNNATKMEERVRKAFEAINSLGTVVMVSITPEYLALAIQELRLTHEYEQKKQDVLEEQREIRERLREEEKALREAQRAQEEAAKEEARYAKALLKARKDLEKAKGAELSEMQAKIALLEASLADAQSQKERAKSMAELTKSGYVYVISNVGSFGENVFKIGMTRRLDPMESSQGARRRVSTVRVRRARHGLHGRRSASGERLPPPLQ